MALSSYATRLNSPQFDPIPATSTRYTMRHQHGAWDDSQTSLGYGKIPPGSVGFSKLPLEPEDARLTGGTRSLPRRLLGLNLTGRIEGSSRVDVAKGISAA